MTPDGVDFSFPSFFSFFSKDYLCALTCALLTDNEMCWSRQLCKLYKSNCK